MIIETCSCQLQIQKWIVNFSLQKVVWAWRSPPSLRASLLFCLAHSCIPEQRTESYKSWNQIQDWFYKIFKQIRKWRIDAEGFLCCGGHFTSCAHLLHWPDSLLLLAAVQGEKYIFFFVFFFSLFFPCACTRGMLEPSRNNTNVGQINLAVTC